MVSSAGLSRFSTRTAIDVLRAYDDHPDGKLDVHEFDNLVRDLNGTRPTAAVNAAWRPPKKGVARYQSPPRALPPALAADDVDAAKQQIASSLVAVDDLLTRYDDITAEQGGDGIRRVLGTIVSANGKQNSPLWRVDRAAKLIAAESSDENGFELLEELMGNIAGADGDAYSSIFVPTGGGTNTEYWLKKASRSRTCAGRCSGSPISSDRRRGRAFLGQCVHGMVTFLLTYTRAAVASRRSRRCRASAPPISAARIRLNLRRRGAASRRRRARGLRARR